MCVNASGGVGGGGMETQFGCVHERMTGESFW